MACLSPVYVKNPTRFFSPEKDKFYLSVPCGKCEQCQQVKRDDWSLRSIMEYEDAKQKGGFSMMLLFTYSQKCVPTFEKVSPYKCKDMCFNSHDVHRFIDSLKKYFKRKHLGEFTYILCSEYGENKTQRPHLHGLFNFKTPSVTPSEILTLCRSYWHYGLVSPHKHADALVLNSYKGARYTSKYVSKQMDFYGRQSVIDLLDNSDLKKKCTHCFPKRYNSKSYGICFFHKLQNLPEEEVIQTLLQGYCLPFDLDVLSIPRYYVNKLKYNKPFKVIENGSVVLTDNGNPVYKRTLSEFGKRFELARFDKLVHDKCLDIEKTFLSSRIETIPLEDLHCYFPLVGNHDDLYYQIRTLLGSVDIKLFATYALFLKDKKNRMFRNDELYGVFPNETSVDEIYDFIKCAYVEFLNCDSYVQNPLTNEYVISEYNSLYGSLSYFADCDLLLYIYCTIKSLTHSYKSLVDVHQQEQVSKLKSYYESL